MPQVPIIMPQLGESIAEATIVSIKVQPGDEVAADQEVIEVETNKAVMGVTTPCAGAVARIDAQVKETYPIGAVLCYIEASEKDAARFTNQTVADVRKEVPKEIPGRADEEKVAAKRRRTTELKRKFPLTDCLFQLRRKAQDSYRRVFAHAWPSCN